MRWTRAIPSQLLLASGAAAGDGGAVAPGNDIYAAYADMHSARRNGGMVRMSGMYDFSKQDFTPTGQGLFSTVVLREYDCEGRRVRLLSAIDFSGHMGAGDAVNTVSRLGRWEPIVSDGIDEKYWDVACGTK